MQAPRKAVDFDVIAQAWQIFVKEPGTFILGTTPLIGYFILNLAVSFAFAGAGAFLGMGGGSEAAAIGFAGGQILLNIVISILGLFVTGYTVGVLGTMALNSIKGRPAGENAFAAAGSRIFSLTGLYFLTALAAGIGAIFCLLPGILIAGLLLPSVGFLLNDNAPVFRSMEESWNAMKPYLWVAAGLVVVLYLIIALGSLLCYLGLLVAYPLFVIACIQIYANLTGLQPCTVQAQSGISPYPRT
jgi:hypothetical protein